MEIVSRITASAQVRRVVLAVAVALVALSLLAVGRTVSGSTAAAGGVERGDKSVAASTLTSRSTKTWNGGCGYHRPRGC
jgi:hypothetical protein